MWAVWVLVRLGQAMEQDPRAFQSASEFESRFFGSASDELFEDELHGKSSRYG